MHRPGGAVSLAVGMAHIFLSDSDDGSFDGLLVSLLHHVQSFVHLDFDRCWYSCKPLHGSGIARYGYSEKCVIRIGLLAFTFLPSSYV